MMRFLMVWCSRSGSSGKYIWNVQGGLGVLPHEKIVIFSRDGVNSGIGIAIPPIPIPIPELELELKIFKKVELELELELMSLELELELELIVHGIGIGIGIDNFENGIESGIEDILCSA